MLRAVIIIAVVSWGCSSSTKNQLSSNPPKPGIDEEISEQVAYSDVGKLKLSDYGFFEGKLADLNPAANVLPYDLNTPLFSDYAAKKRFLFIPEGQRMTYRPKEVLDLPEGTVLIKNFYYDSHQTGWDEPRIIETRLLLLEEGRWKSLPYIWNSSQTEAYLEITGGKLTVELLSDKQILYAVPTMTECKSCHDRGGEMVPIGPSVRQLNRDYDYADGRRNQLVKMASLGWIDLPDATLEKLAVWNDPTSGSLDERARAYLDINCAHCHNDEGPAKNSGLNLSIYETDPYRLGLNKRPVAAGRGSADLRFAIEAGQPDNSILVHRMTINDPGTRMPEIGRSLVHEEGLDLIREWIKHM